MKKEKLFIVQGITAQDVYGPQMAPATDAVWLPYRGYHALWMIDINQIIVCPILFYEKKFVWIGKSAYLCTVFFIVLDLRLTKVGSQR